MYIYAIYTHVCFSCFLLFAGLSRAVNLELVWSMIHTCYQNSGVKCRLGGIRLSRGVPETPGGDPCLNGKAAETLHLGPALRWLFQQGMDRNEEMHSG